LPLWNVIPQLNTIFNNPNILKVLHGAYMDVKWLHRDFDIKLSNLFDTFHAAQHLSHQQCSYAYLLKHYCEIKTDKKYQMADWRERPLS
jgi:exosome complex exonuclease RRP6